MSLVTSCMHARPACHPSWGELRLPRLPSSSFLTVRVLIHYETCHAFSPVGPRLRIGQPIASQLQRSDELLALPRPAALCAIPDHEWKNIRGPLGSVLKVSVVIWEVVMRVEPYIPCSSLLKPIKGWATNIKGMMIRGGLWPRAVVHLKLGHGCAWQGFESRGANVLDGSAACTQVRMIHHHPTCRVCSSCALCLFSRKSPATRTEVTSVSVLCLTRRRRRFASMICCFPLLISSCFSPSLPPASCFQVQHD